MFAAISLAALRVTPNAMQTTCVSPAVLLYCFVATLCLNPTLRYHVKSLRGDQLLSSSNHAEPLPFHVFQTASVTNSQKETSKYAEAPLCCTTPSCSHNVCAFSDRLELTGLTLRRLMSYIYGAPILDVSRSHTTTQHSR